MLAAEERVFPQRTQIGYPTPNGQPSKYTSNRQAMDANWCLAQLLSEKHRPVADGNSQILCRE